MTSQMASASRDYGLSIECDNTVPLRIDDLARDLNATWLTKALSKKNRGLVVESVNIVRVSVSTSIKLWMDFTFNEVGRRARLPTRMVIKGGFGRLPGMEYTYDIEMHSYLQVVPNSP